MRSATTALLAPFACQRCNQPLRVEVPAADIVHEVGVYGDGVHGDGVHGDGVHGDGCDDAKHDIAAARARDATTRRSTTHSSQRVLNGQLATAGQVPHARRSIHARWSFDDARSSSLDDATARSSQDDDDDDDDDDESGASYDTLSPIPQEAMSVILESGSAPLDLSNNSMTSTAHARRGTGHGTRASDPSAAMNTPPSHSPVKLGASLSRFRPSLSSMLSSTSSSMAIASTATASSSAVMGVNAINGALADSSSLPAAVAPTSSPRFMRRQQSPMRMQPDNMDIVDPRQTPADPPLYTIEPSFMKKLAHAHRLFDELSTVTSDALDHPLCQECADVLVEKVERECMELAQEKELYEVALRRLASDGDAMAEGYDDAGAAASSSMEELLAEERELLSRLSAIDAERLQLRKETEDLEKQASELDLAEESRWVSINAQDMELTALLQDEKSAQRQHDLLTAQLDRLQKTNVYHDTFFIWHDGLRMGRLPGYTVEWTEINAAWGQALFLLDLLARKTAFTFTHHLLHPHGSFSRIERIAETPGASSTMLELYGSGENSVTRLVWNRQFELAMVAFLQCLGELGAFCESRDSQFRLPYPIIKEKIGNVSIRLQFNHDEQWTKACKYVLTNLKWLMAHVCNTSSGRTQ